jgi:thiol-disulfide isomerase/thioredoxin
MTSARALRRTTAVLAALALLAALAIFGLAGTSAARRVAPQLPATHLSGPRVTLESLLAGAHGRGTLVTFWASWCTPCAQEAGALERFATSAAGRGRIVGVNFSDGATAARAFIRSHGWTFANLRDTYGQVGNAYRMRNLPTTFAIDATGHIAEVLEGPQTAASLTRAVAGA